MSYSLLQLSPQSTRGTDSAQAPGNFPLRRAGDIDLLLSWLESYDEQELGAKGRNARWGAAAGVAVALAVGASFWTGVGFIVARLWR